MLLIFPLKGRGMGRCCIYSRLMFTVFYPGRCNFK